MALRYIEPNDYHDVPDSDHHCLTYHNKDFKIDLMDDIHDCKKCLQNYSGENERELSIPFYKTMIGKVVVGMAGAITVIIIILLLYKILVSYPEHKKQEQNELWSQKFGL